MGPGSAAYEQRRFGWPVSSIEQYYGELIRDISGRERSPADMNC